MARPCKPASLLTECSQTKEEINERIEHENKLRGELTKLVPSDNLTDAQKEIFYENVRMLESAEILSDKDVYLLEKFAIAIDRIQAIEEIINADSSQLYNSKLLSANDKYTKDFFRCCNELGFSPQSRAKIANISIQKETKDPLLEILSDGDDDD